MIIIIDLTTTKKKIKGRFVENEGSFQFTFLTLIIVNLFLCPQLVGIDKTYTDVCSKYKMYLLENIRSVFRQLL